MLKEAGFQARTGLLRRYLPVSNGEAMRAGAVGTLLITLLAVPGCANVAGPEGSGAQAASSAVQTTPAASVHPITRRVRECAAGDLVVHFKPEREGAGGHLLSLLEIRNVSTTSCLLSGYPRRVTLHEPGHSAVTATEGSFFPVAASEPMKPGGVTTLGVETVAACAARPGGGPSGPMYHEVRIALSGGVIIVTAPNGRGLDVGCGAHLTKFTRWQ